MVKPTKLQTKAGDRIVILGRVKGGDITLKQASELLKISYRHAKRLYKRFKTAGVMGLVPKKRTKPPCNKTTEEISSKILYIKMQFPEINCCHLADYLKEQGITISHETIRTILIKNHLHNPGHKRRPRKRFEAEKAGKLVQMDTSPFAGYQLLIKNCNSSLPLMTIQENHSP